MAKVYKEYFRLISRKTCCCGQVKTNVYSWGEYRAAKWHTVEYICSNCWNHYATKLNSYKSATGCSFLLVGKDCKLPSWLTLDKA